ncbi:MAG: pyridoxamine 5'-phosphate oxidase [Phycisphaerales bacterium]
MSRFSKGTQYHTDRFLPDPLPPDPVHILKDWIDEATRKQIVTNPNAISLATSTPDGRPSVRIVLAKDVTPDGRLIFFTNYESRKGRELADNPRAAATFFWDALSLQARIEGPVTLLSDKESDEYFASRWILSRLGAWASDQSRPIHSREAMLDRVLQVAAKFSTAPDGSGDANIPRPPHWGGYSIWAEAIELWIGQPGRIHDRGLWQRHLAPAPHAFTPGEWTASRLQP